jgi:hypothetical protein
MPSVLREINFINERFIFIITENISNIPKLMRLGQVHL